MRQSQLFTKTFREDPKDEVSVNAKLLERGGFVYKNSAGVYTYLPLGWRVLEKIVAIVRKEMDAVGGQEFYMPALVEKKYMDATGRWDVDISFEVRGKNEGSAHFTLGWTHEEILAAIATKYVSSYKDLPFAAYQFQTKFRNEPRAKSGLLRGREFLMKDLYSFHATEEDLFRYYGEVKDAYERIFKRCGLETVYTHAGGGAFTMQTTHEFQVITDAGEDTVFVCAQCRYAENKEISKLKDGDRCPKCGGVVGENHAVEVGNIFPLGTKYSEAFGLMFRDESGARKPVVMGSYGMGIGRLMATVVEVYHDEKGIIWPEIVAPYQVHLVEIKNPAFAKASAGRQKSNIKNGEVEQEAAKLYEQLQEKGTEVLYDDRDDKTAGEKFADADLIGIPVRVVVSEKTLIEGAVEVKKRVESKTTLVEIEKLLASYG
ncbi:MAG: hypothetical protein HYS57_00075 [Parcubacteria group bacterium]|nr:hypothetical protein [Parcubacteria group bacterium]